MKFEISNINMEDDYKKFLCNDLSNKFLGTFTTAFDPETQGLFVYWAASSIIQSVMKNLVTSYIEGYCSSYDIGLYKKAYQ